MRKLSALIALLAALLPLTTAPRSAQAAPITYNFVTTSTTGPLSPSEFLSTLTVDSAALNTGLNFVSTCFLNPPFNCTRSGNWQDLIGLSFASTESGFLAMNLTFNTSNGTITGTIDNDGLEQNLHLAGNQFLWSTTSPFFSDFLPQCGSNAVPPCGVTGYYFTANPLANTAVPEPASMITVGTALALFGGFAIHRRRRNS